MDGFFVAKLVKYADGPKNKNKNIDDDDENELIDMNAEDDKQSELDDDSKEDDVVENEKNESLLNKKRKNKI